MAEWLRRDLQKDSHQWTIAYFHHPPYTKGTHDSDMDLDSRGRMKEMRENILPILEENGVDLVLGGHSHIYERTYLIQGHYGYSDEFDPGRMIVKKQKKYKNNKSAIFKDSTNIGTVYIVCGVSGSHPSSGTFNHPAIAVYKSRNRGSMSLEIRGNQLLAVFVDEHGSIKDSFSITKE
jgi:3',5'-cyclic AMP phosphodiesterase CpdA